MIELCISIVMLLSAAAALSAEFLARGPNCLASAQMSSCCALSGWKCINLVDPASSHMLVSKIKPCMSQYKLLYGETANGSLKQL